jgi:hypothetical protein
VKGQRPEICSLEGLDLPRLDPAIVAAAIVGATSKLGLVITGSTLLEQPYAFARRMQSLDHLSGGARGLERRHHGHRGNCRCRLWRSHGGP